MPACLGNPLVAVSSVNGVVTIPGSALLVAKSTQDYDSQGQTNTYSVNPANGVVGNAITTNTFRDLRGDVIATYSSGQPTEKSVFDGAGRDVMDYTTDGGAVNNSGTPLVDWADADSVASDVVVSQTQKVYDHDGDVIETIEKDRLPDDPVSADGPLGGTISDAGFELPSVGSGYSYDPPVSSANPWTFAGTSGVAGNDSAFTSGNPNAPEGRSPIGIGVGGSGHLHGDPGIADETRLATGPIYPVIPVQEVADIADKVLGI